MLKKPVKNEETNRIHQARVVIGSVLVKKLHPTFQP